MGTTKRWQRRWTPNMVKSLAYLYKQGLSASEAAAEMTSMYWQEIREYDGGFSRNAIIGKWHRMGLKRGRPVALRAAEGHAAKKTKGPRRKRKAVKNHFDIRMSEEDYLIDAVQFGELEPSDCRCRWPIMTGGWCGHPVEHKRSYCKHHLLRAYQQVKHGQED